MTIQYVTIGNQKYPVNDGAKWDDFARLYATPFTAYEVEVILLGFVDFLQLTERNNWASHVKHDFADVSLLPDGSIRQVDKQKWWWQHSHLFLRLRLNHVDLVDVHDEVELDNQIAWAQGGRFKLAMIDTHQPSSVLRKQFHALLDSLGVDERESYRYSDNEDLPRTGHNGDYGIYMPDEGIVKPTLVHLYKVLNTYQQVRLKLRGELELGKNTYYEIEDALNAAGKPLIKRTDKYGHDKQPPLKDQQAKAISKYKKQASNLLKNVVNGIFPKFD